MKTLFVAAVASLAVFRVGLAAACSPPLTPVPITHVVVGAKDDLPKNLGIPLGVPDGTATVAADEVSVKQGDSVIAGAATQVGNRWFWKPTSGTLPVGLLDVMTKGGDHATVEVRDRVLGAENPSMAIAVDTVDDAAPDAQQITCNVQLSGGIGSCGGDPSYTTHIPTHWIALPRINPTATRPFSSDDAFLDTTITAFGRNGDGTVMAASAGKAGLDGQSTIVDRAYDEYCVTTSTTLGEDAPVTQTICKPQALDLTVDQAKSDGFVKDALRQCTSVVYPAGYTPPAGTTTALGDTEHGDPEPTTDEPAAKSGSSSSSSTDDGGCNASGHGVSSSFALLALALVVSRRRARVC